jgi:tetratricopeptide (TPR) repeat protein/TolB-like protein
MRPGLIKDLFRRRLPQILGAYFAGGWVVLEFTDWLVNRYLLSPHLTDFAMLVWALMIPTVAMLAYFHGAPGPDSWTMVEKIGIPLNVVLAASVLLTVFAGRDLGAATETVTLETEEGRTIERVVPKTEFTKSLTSYFFDNVSGDTALDWLQYGIPSALRYDLEQDLFLDIRGAQSQMRRLREEGFRDGLRVSLPLKRELADELHVAFFVSGEIDKNADQLVVRTRLYETQRGNLVEEREFRGSDIFKLVDEMSVQLKHDLEIPSQDIEETRDLPVAEILTSSEAAYRALVAGNRTIIIDNNYELGARHLEEAVGLDPQFAMAHLLRFAAYLNLGRVEEAQRALEQAMALLYKLPERTQLAAKAAYYWLVKQDLHKAIAAAGMHAELYPQDLRAHEALAELYSLRQDKDRAISELETVLKLDPSRIDALRSIAALYEVQGDFDTAFAYYQRYAEEAPTDPEVFVSLGRLRHLQGKHEAAREEYEKATLIDPGYVPALIQLANLNADLGRFDDAGTGFDDALDAAVTPEQRAQVYNALRAYYVFRGQPTRAIEFTHRLWAQLQQYLSPFEFLQQKLQSLDAYLAAGQAATARDTIESIATRLSPPFDVLVPLGWVSLYLDLENPDSLEMAADGLDRLIDAFGLEEVGAFSVYARGRALELRGDCRQAIISYKRALELQPRNIDWRRDIGRCLRKLGRLAEAAGQLEQVLKVGPSDPEAHYELALVYADGGETAKAREHLEYALRVWEDAEPQYEPAREAREKLAELSGDS